jgi:hypothetical protein
MLLVAVLMLGMYQASETFPVLGHEYECEYATHGRFRRRGPS